jgi:hypothetical protein
MEIASYIKEEEEKAKNEATRKAQGLLAMPSNQYAKTETVNAKKSVDSGHAKRV